MSEYPRLTYSIDHDETLPTLLETLNSISEPLPIVIPEIQRPFSWDKERCSMLLSSVLLGFPIGSILVLDGEENLFEFSDFQSSSRGKSRLRFLLDGQQRLKTLFYSFCLPNHIEFLRKKDASPDFTYSFLLNTLNEEVEDWLKNVHVTNDKDIPEKAFEYMESIDRDIIDLCVSQIKHVDIENNKVTSHLFRLIKGKKKITISAEISYTFHKDVMKGFEQIHSTLEKYNEFLEEVLVNDNYKQIKTAKLEQTIIELKTHIKVIMDKIKAIMASIAKKGTLYVPSNLNEFLSEKYNLPGCIMYYWEGVLKKLVEEISHIKENIDVLSDNDKSSDDKKKFRENTRELINEHEAWLQVLKEGKSIVEFISISSLFPFLYSKAPISTFLQSAFTEVLLDNLNTILSRLKSIKIPIIILKGSVMDMTEVFARLNQNPMPLSPFELVVARTFKKDPSTGEKIFSLSDSLNSILVDENGNLSEFISNFFEIKLDLSGEITQETREKFNHVMVRSLLLFSKNLVETKEWLNLVTDDALLLFDNSEKTGGTKFNKLCNLELSIVALETTIQFLNNLGVLFYSELRYERLFELFFSIVFKIIISVQSKNKGEQAWKKIWSHVSTELTKWYWLVVFSPSFGRSPQIKLQKAWNIWLKLIEDNVLNSSLNTSDLTNFRKIRLIDYEFWKNDQYVTPNQNYDFQMNFFMPASKGPFFQFIRKMKPCHLLNKYRNTTPLQFNSDYSDSERHHIFPKKFIEKSKEEKVIQFKDNILNLTILTDVENNEIGEIPPWEYLTSNDERLESHLIQNSKSLWPTRKPESEKLIYTYCYFLKERYKLIAKKIASAQGVKLAEIPERFYLQICEEFETQDFDLSELDKYDLQRFADEDFSKLKELANEQLGLSFPKGTKRQTVVNKIIEKQG